MSSGVDQPSKGYRRKCTSESAASKTVFDQRRKLMHKEIERRRRDRINDWIMTLAKQVPECSSDNTKQGQSKGGILAKTVEYIHELRNENFVLEEKIVEQEKQSEQMFARLAQLENENTRLKNLLESNKVAYK